MVDDVEACLGEEEEERADEDDIEDDMTGYVC